MPKEPDKGSYEKAESKKEFVIEFLKKDTLDQSIKNAKELYEIERLYGNYNYSFERPEQYISEIYDSINKRSLLTFDPKFTFADKATYLLDDNTKGKVTHYTITLVVNDKNELETKSTHITYSKAGEIEYRNNEVPPLNSLVDEKSIATKIEIIDLEKKALKQKEEHEKQMLNFEKNCLSSWDGSHRELVKVIKQNMNNPKSFEHVETRYGVTGNYVGIVMIYRGSNDFGAIVTNSVKAKVNLEDCSIISIE